ncbi:MAG: hypothetical protein R3A44_28515 [Caldilineaceae bacterium]
MAILLMTLLIALIAVGVGLLTLIGAWLLTLLLSLTFMQAVMISGACVVTILYLTQRDLPTDMSFSITFTIFIPLLLYVLLAGLSWLVRLVAPLSVWESALFCMVVLLAGAAQMLGRSYEIDLDALMDEDEDDEDDVLVYVAPKQTKKSRRRQPKGRVVKVSPKGNE